MNDRSTLIAPVLHDAASLDKAVSQEMFSLYERYYEGVSYRRFSADLADKDRVLLLRDAVGTLQGFSTLTVYERNFLGDSVRILFSGDTVVDEQHWGQQALALSWLRLAGEIKAQCPERPLYWFLISKGHRTYRYLSAFSRAFYPAPEREMPTQMRDLMAFLATDRFGAAYDADDGVLRFTESHGHLRSVYAQVSDAHRRLPQVDFFLRSNPGYTRGDELVCLCELSADNLQPIARRAFLAGACPQRHPQ
jgi:hypothetical protein